jgi:hypothetical protein
MAFTQFGSSVPNVRYRTLASGTNSTIKNLGYRLAGDAAVLENLWRSTLQQGTKLPMVDFTKDRVAIFFLGERSSGGYTVSVQSMMSKGGATAEVMLNEMTPAEGSMRTMALTAPWVMVAVDRSYLDFNVNSFKTQTPPAGPWIPTGPGGAWLPAPWTPCFSGYGGNWGYPCGYVFDDWRTFSQWGYDNDLYYMNQSPSIIWGQQRLACVSVGNWGLGFDLNIAGVQMRGNVAVVQVTRSQQTIVRGVQGGQQVGGQRGRGRQGAPFVTLGVQRSVQQIQVEMLDTRSNCLVTTAKADVSALPSGLKAGAYLMNSSRETDRQLGAFAPQLGDPVRLFNYKSEQLAIAYLGETETAYNFLGVVYRDQEAILQFAPVKSGRGTINPVHAIRIQSGIKKVRLEDVSQQRLR